MTDTSGRAPPRMGLVVAASSAGTVFEWYDFFVFGSLTPIIARSFFAYAASETQAYIFALLAFAAGFAVRPVGALVFGHFGDRVGRKRAFLVTVTVMGLATFAMGLLPDAHAIGPVAAYILLGLRMLQGFAVGGEYGGAAIYVAEHAGRKRRGAATGWIQVSATVGLFLALAVILAAQTALGKEAFASWGWRIPFLLSVVLLGVSLWIRLQLEESPLFKALQAEGRTARAPLSEAFGRWKNLRLVLIVLVGILMGQGVVWYTAEIYALNFLQRTAAVDLATVTYMMLIATAVAAPLHFFFAWISDFIGRKPVMLFGLGLAAVMFLPAFRALTEAVNPALTHAAASMPVTVVAAPADCSVQFDPIGKTRFTSSCDLAKSALANRGIPYANQSAPDGTVARVAIGGRSIESFDAAKLGAKDLAARRATFDKNLRAALTSAGYPSAAQAAAIDMPRALFWLIVLMVAASALYGPQAAALVELFPTRIRYSALSLPYHVGVGWFGGFLPAAAFAIVAETGNIYAGLWYPVVVSVIGFFVSLFLLPETRGRDIAA